MIALAGLSLTGLGTGLPYGDRICVKPFDVASHADPVDVIPDRLGFLQGAHTGNELTKAVHGIARVVPQFPVASEAADLQVTKEVGAFAVACPSDAPLCGVLF